MASRAGVGHRLRAALERRRRLRPARAREARSSVRHAHAHDREGSRVQARSPEVTRILARLRRLPLRVRLALAGTLLLPLALALVFALVFLRFESELNSTIDADLRARSDALVAIVKRQGPGALDGRAAADLLRPLGGFAQVVDANGRVLSSSASVDHVRVLTTG